MAPLDNQAVNLDDDRSIASRVRRKRRSSIGVHIPSHNNNNNNTTTTLSSALTNTNSTPPATPKRVKKRVRFSDPGPEIQSDFTPASSGLTPSLHRTFLSSSSSSTPASKTKTKRRHSIPATLSSRRVHNDTPISGTLQFAPLRQVLDGRVTRRLRRNRLSEEINTIETVKKVEKRQRKQEVNRLREALKEKDLEVQYLQDEHDLETQLGGEVSSFESGSILSTKVVELQEEIRELREKLDREQSAHSSHDEHEEHDWSLANRDPFDFHDDDNDHNDDEDDGDENTIMNYDDENENENEDFSMDMGNDEIQTTPKRLHVSFPSPPSTHPPTPTPCLSATASSCSTSTGIQTSYASTNTGIQTSYASINTGIQTSYASINTGMQTSHTTTNTGIQTSPFSTDTGIQASIPDPETEDLKQQLQSLSQEMEKLHQQMAFNNDHHTRLTSKLSDFLPLDQSHDHTTLDAALDRVLTTLTLSQSQALEHESAFSALSNEIIALGFEAETVDGALEKIATQFRQARLDLEYIIPGEVTSGFENEKLLGLLVDRVRTLVAGMKERDESIDAYHSQELSLREQLNTRVQAMDDMKVELATANQISEGLEQEVEGLGTGNERLKTALDGYRSEVQKLETLINGLEEEGREKEKDWNDKIAGVESKLQFEVLAHDRAKADAEGKDILIKELEKRLGAALKAAEEIQQQLDSVSDENREKEEMINELNSEHGAALAVRDKQVRDLREEVEKVNSSLKNAQETILGLKNENTILGEKVQEEKQKGWRVVNMMREQLKGVLSLGSEYVGESPSAPEKTKSGGPGSSPLVGKGNGNGSGIGFGFGGSTVGFGGLATPQSGLVSKGRFLDGEYTRRPGSSGMGKKRRRYDSGLGFLEEESEGEMGMAFSSDL